MNDTTRNINQLVRTNYTGGTMADDIYKYKENQLNQINSLTAYTYDRNGNTTLDGLRGFTIAYNSLNLPKSITSGTDNIAYIYSAAGAKLAKKKSDGTYLYYTGNMVYNNAKTLNYLLFEEGLVNKSTGGYTYEYHLKDHLGNTRISFQPSGSTPAVTQVAEYYPFGSTYLPIYNGSGTSNKYLYNGKEKQDDVLGTGSTALDWYDYGARFYDPQIARWLSVDPLANKYYANGPNTYCANNPIRFIDPDGKKIVDANGNEMYTQKGGWTKYASQDAITFNKAMMQSDKSRNQWNKLVESPMEVQLEINSGRNPEHPDSNGTTKPNWTIDSKSNTWKISGQKITLWGEKLNESIKKGEKSKGLSLEQAIAATGSHEIEHAVDEKNIQLQEERGNEQDKTEKARIEKEIESEPTKIGDEVREQIRNQPKEIAPIIRPIQL